MSDPKDLIDGNLTSQIIESDVFDVEGNKVKLGSLFDTQKTILVFIRKSYLPHNHLSLLLILCRPLLLRCTSISESMICSGLIQMYLLHLAELPGMNSLLSSRLFMVNEYRFHSSTAIRGATSFGAQGGLREGWCEDSHHWLRRMETDCQLCWCVLITRRRVVK
jgi:hypothetical protein